MEITRFFLRELSEKLDASSAASDAFLTII